MPSRRSTLIGVGGIVAGGGALVGSGAFDTVEATRTVSVETADDADAFLGLEPARDALDLPGEDFVEETDGTIRFELGGEEEGGLNRNARSAFDRLLLVTNRGTRAITRLTLEFTETPVEVDPDETFGFPVAATDGFEITSNTGGVANGGDVLEEDVTPSELAPGDAVVVGLRIDLLDGGDDGDLPVDDSYLLTIEAHDSGRTDDDPEPPEPAVLAETGATDIVPPTDGVAPFGDDPEYSGAQFDALEGVSLADPFTIAVEAPELAGRSGEPIAVTAFYDEFDGPPSDRLGPANALDFDDDAIATVSVGSDGTGADLVTSIALGGLADDATLINAIETPEETTTVAVEVGTGASGMSVAATGGSRGFENVESAGLEDA
ncbi:hypothetical protein AB7C87_18940 [Natrarchaeobius sp. A-rgal3]|uniref:hypothetical protein n=1 Tax=Natrarchaeobius versutus TaxID=1679078 RepID=UPI00350F7502